MLTKHYFQLMWWDVRDSVFEYLKPFTWLYRKVTNG